MSDNVKLTSPEHPEVPPPLDPVHARRVAELSIIAWLNDKGISTQNGEAVRQAAYNMGMPLSRIYMNAECKHGDYKRGQGPLNELAAFAKDLRKIVSGDRNENIIVQVRNRAKNFYSLMALLSIKIPGKQNETDKPSTYEEPILGIRAAMGSLAELFMCSEENMAQHATALLNNPMLDTPERKATTNAEQTDGAVEIAGCAAQLLSRLTGVRHGAQEATEGKTSPAILLTQAVIKAVTGIDEYTLTAKAIAAGVQRNPATKESISKAAECWCSKSTSL